MIIFTTHKDLPWLGIEPTTLVIYICNTDKTQVNRRTYIRGKCVSVCVCVCVPRLLAGVHLAHDVVHPERERAHLVEEAVEVVGVLQLGGPRRARRSQRRPRLAHLRLAPRDLRRLLARVHRAQALALAADRLHLQAGPRSLPALTARWAAVRMAFCSCFPPGRELILATLINKKLIDSF